MEVDMIRSQTLALALASAFALGACGGDSDNGSTPTGNTPTTNTGTGTVPQVAGVYSNSQLWVHQVLRTSDGFITSFTCSGSITLTQRPGSTSGRGDTITGFAVVGSPCPPVSFDLSGSVAADGSISFVSGGPKPPQGPCPPAANVPYSGGVFGRQINLRGSAVVTCPEFGEHRFTYIISAFKS
jgi:hypothetical protein